MLAATQQQQQQQPQQPQRALVRTAVVAVLVGAVLTVGVLLLTSDKTRVPRFAPGEEVAAANPGAGQGQWTAEAGLSEGSQGKAWHARKVRSLAPSLRVFSAPSYSPATCTKRTDAEWTPFLHQRSTPMKCDKWAVITTIFDPTKLAHQLAAMGRTPSKEWCAVFVGDKKSPPEKVWRDAFANEPWIIYLSPEEQTKLPYQVAHGMKWNHFSRKNIGYLFAIHHGARIVYDTDDDNALREDGRGMAEWVRRLLGGDVGGGDSVPVWRTQSRVVNPLMDFGAVYESVAQPLVAWPRGFPINQIRDPATFRMDGSVSPPPQPIPASKVGVLQGLADHDPDVDAIYRMTRHTPFRFSHTPRAVAMPRNALSPYNAQATLIRAEALWSAFLPTTVHGRVSDIWRSYIAQRLMWDVDLYLAFCEPLVTQFRNAHNYLGDFNAEQHLYDRADELTKFLVEWAPTPGAPRTIASRLEDLVVALYEIGVLEVDDVTRTQMWLRDLCAMGYAFPALSAATNEQDENARRQEELKRGAGKPATVVDGRNDEEEDDEKHHVAPRTAVCLVGTTAELRADELRRNVLEPLRDYDVFVLLHGSPGKPAGADVCAALASAKVSNGVHCLSSSSSSAAASTSVASRQAWSAYDGPGSGPDVEASWRDARACARAVQDYVARFGTAFTYGVRVRTDARVAQPLAHPTEWGLGSPVAPRVLTGAAPCAWDSLVLSRFNDMLVDAFRLDSVAVAFGGGGVGSEATKKWTGQAAAATHLVAAANATIAVAPVGVVSCVV